MNHSLATKEKGSHKRIDLQANIHADLHGNHLQAANRRAFQSDAA